LVILAINGVIISSGGVLNKRIGAHKEMLTEKEKAGALKILSLLPETEVVSLAKTVTKSQLIIVAREGKLKLLLPVPDISACHLYVIS